MNPYTQTNENVLDELLIVYDEGTDDDLSAECSGGGRGDGAGGDARGDGGNMEGFCGSGDGQEGDCLGAGAGPDDLMFLTSSDIDLWILWSAEQDLG